MRGKGAVFTFPYVYTRITPAYAGKSNALENAGYFAGDHPRLCGEKDENENPIIATEGSPPPMRGKANANFNHLPASRITPAYAGKSQGLCPRSRSHADHPRLCGEKLSFSQSTSDDFRITPAYAGKRAFSAWKNLSQWDHPRLCGEKTS